MRARAQLASRDATKPLTPQRVRHTPGRWRLSPHTRDGEVSRRYPAALHHDLRRSLHHLVLALDLLLATHSMPAPSIRPPPLRQASATRTSSAERSRIERRYVPAPVSHRLSPRAQLPRRVAWARAWGFPPVLEIMLRSQQNCNEHAKDSMGVLASSIWCVRNTPDGRGHRSPWTPPLRRIVPNLSHQ